MEQIDAKEMTCNDCQKTFYWTKGEQDFFAKKGFTAPKRCMACRVERRKKMDKTERGQRAGY